MIGLGAVMLKLKIAKAKEGMFQFIPPKLDLRYWGLKVRTNGGASILRSRATAKDERPTLRDWAVTQDLLGYK